MFLSEVDKRLLSMVAARSGFLPKTGGLITCSLLPANKLQTKAAIKQPAEPIRSYGLVSLGIAPDINLYLIII